MKTITPLVVTVVLAALTSVAALAQGGNPPASTKESGQTSGRGMTSVEQGMPKSAEQTLLDMENQWAKASAASNADAIAPMLSDDFVNTDSDGKVYGKAETLAHIKGAKWQTNQVSDMKTLVYGNTGVVTGAWIGKGTDATGKKVDAKERWTDTWAKMRNGKWQCIASQSTPMN